MSLYKGVKKLNIRGTIQTPGLGFTPVIVKDVRVLSKDALKVVRRYVGKPVPRKVYTYVADPEYVKALKRSGFRVEPSTGEEDGILIRPAIKHIYGDGAKGDYVVERAGKFVTSYPPWGYYDASLKRIYVFEPLADKLPLIVHEATHYAIDALGIEELKSVEEFVARLNEMLVAFNAPPIPVKRLSEALKDEKITQQLIRLARFLGSLLEPRIMPKNLMAFIELVDAVEFGNLNAETLSRILRGELELDIKDEDTMQMLWEETST